MSVHCPQCGHDNDLQHTFCGMCGAKLPLPETTAGEPGRQNPAVPVSRGSSFAGSSLLGLGDEPTDRDRLSYLLHEDDEEVRPRRSRYVLLLVLVAGIVAAGWYWHQDLRNWVHGSPKSAAPSDAVTTNQAAPVPSDPPSDVSSSPPPQPNPEQPAPATPPAQTTPSEPPKPTEPAATADQAAATNPEPEPEKPAAVETDPPNRQTSAKPTVRPTDVKALELEGEKYLYGNGVPEDCPRANKVLLVAASRSSVKAQSVLGTMYATGHCVSRDLPLAYRWFAKALRQDPNNARLESDLQVLWRQMTPEERQLAQRKEP